MTGLLAALLFLLGISCAFNAGGGQQPTEPPITGRQTALMEVTVDPELVDCVGVGPRKCLVVDGRYFYDAIEGFDHEPGYRYRLRMERYDAWPGMAEPPQDASRYSYRLIEIIDKVQEP